MFRGIFLQQTTERVGLYFQRPNACKFLKLARLFHLRPNYYCSTFAPIIGGVFSVWCIYWAGFSK
jgi:hypothetical protein